MGSKKKANADPNVNAYGTTMKTSEKNKIDSYNSSERQRGQTLDNNYVAQKNAIVQKEGTVDFKKFLKTRLTDLKSILGVKK